MEWPAGNLRDHFGLVCVWSWSIFGVQSCCAQVQTVLFSEKADFQSALKRWPQVRFERPTTIKVTSVFQELPSSWHETQSAMRFVLEEFSIHVWGENPFTVALFECLAWSTCASTWNWTFTAQLHAEGMECRSINAGEEDQNGHGLVCGRLVSEKCRFSGGLRCNERNLSRGFTFRLVHDFFSQLDSCGNCLRCCTWHHRFEHVEPPCAFQLVLKVPSSREGESQNHKQWSSACVTNFL